MAQAAGKHDMKPRSIGFKAVVQTLNGFQSQTALNGERDAAFRLYLNEQIVDAIATHQVSHPPDRFERLRKKRRPKLYDRV